MNDHNASSGKESSKATMAEEEKKYGTYEAGCHCGYIKLSVRLSPPLPEYEVLDCGCSMCVKSGYLLVCKSWSLY